MCEHWYYISISILSPWSQRRKCGHSNIVEEHVQSRLPGRRSWGCHVCKNRGGDPLGKWNPQAYSTRLECGHATFFVMPTSWEIEAP